MDLQQGESVIYEGHPSWRSILHFYILGILAVVVVAAAAAGISQIVEDEVKPGWVAIAAIVAFLVLVLVGWLKRMSTDYMITDRRLIIRRGILSRHVDQTRVDRVQNVTSSQSLLQRILRVGTVDFDTASNEPQNTFAFRGVSDPQGVVKKVDEATHAATGPGAAQQQAAPPQQQAPPPSPPAS